MSIPVSPAPSASNDSPPPEVDAAAFEPTQDRLKSWSELRRESMLAEFQMWMAPFPPPQAVVEYEKVLPGNWDRLLRMAEQAQAADILNVEYKEKYVQRQFRLGQLLGIFALLVAMGCALYCVKLNQPWVAAAFLSMTVMAAARSFFESIAGRSTLSRASDHESGPEAS
jgi:uncharacterized membrane protein